MCVSLGRLLSQTRLQISRAAFCGPVVAITLVVGVGCGNPHVPTASDINLVRNGFLKVPPANVSAVAYGTATIGEALERKFPNGSWRQYSSPDGMIVEFDGAVLPATLYENGFPVWSPFLTKETAAVWGVPGEKGSVSLRAATTCMNDTRKHVAVGHNGGRIVIDCTLLFRMQFVVSADRRSVDLHYISLDTFDTDDQGRALGFIYGLTATANANSGGRFRTSPLEAVSK